jgi:hypothetical protein
MDVDFDLEIVCELDIPPGNIAVNRDYRTFFNSNDHFNLFGNNFFDFTGTSVLITVIAVNKHAM